MFAAEGNIPRIAPGQSAGSGRFAAIRRGEPGQESSTQTFGCLIERPSLDDAASLFKSDRNESVGDKLKNRCHSQRMHWKADGAIEDGSQFASDELPRTAWFSPHELVS